MNSSRVIVYLNNVIFHRLQRRLSDRNYRFRLRPKYLIFSQFVIYCYQNALPPGLCPGPRWGGAYDAPDPSWETLDHTLAEGPTEWRGPGPRDPTIRHGSYAVDFNITVHKGIAVKLIGRLASFFRGTHNVRDELQLPGISFCGLGSKVRVEVLGSVNSNHNHNPKHIYNPNPNPTLTLILTLTLNLP